MEISEKLTEKIQAAGAVLDKYTDLLPGGRNVFSMIIENVILTGADPNESYLGALFPTVTEEDLSVLKAATAAALEAREAFLKAKK